VVDLDVFEQHLGVFLRRCTPVSLRAYLDWLDGDTDLPSNAILLTFDDGYHDFRDHALPVLQKGHIPCVLFPTLRSAEGEAVLPVDRLYVGLARALAGNELGARDLQDWLRGDRKRTYLRADAPSRVTMLKGAGLWHDDLDPRSLYLQRRDLEALPPDEVALGGHGAGHDLLVGREVGELATELERVHAWLASLRPGASDRRVPFAYPNGSHDDACTRAVAQAGFSAAFTVQPSHPGTGARRWSLPRSCVPNQPDAPERLARGEPLGI
jgi:peptidoglycan/xylan/chitin deacetylase (PgdA/CDA1 family)